MNYSDLKQNLIHTVLKLEYMFHEFDDLLEKYREDLIITRTLLEKEEEIIDGKITESDFLMEDIDEEKEEEIIVAKTALSDFSMKNIGEEHYGENNAEFFDDFDKCN